MVNENINRIYSYGTGYNLFGRDWSNVCFRTIVDIITDDTYNYIICYDSSSIPTYKIYRGMIDISSSRFLQIHQFGFKSSELLSFKSNFEFGLDLLLKYLNCVHFICPYHNGSKLFNQTNSIARAVEYWNNSFIMANEIEINILLDPRHAIWYSNISDIFNPTLRNKSSNGHYDLLIHKSYGLFRTQLLIF